MAATGNNIGMDATKDEQHGTPEHDELTRWIAKKENYEKIAKLIQAKKKEEEKENEEFLNKSNDEFWGLVGEKARAESKVESERAHKNDKIEYSYNIQLEQPLYNGKFLVGIVDAIIIMTETLTTTKMKDYEYVWGETDNYFTTTKIPVEIKPKITRLGDTLRQIKIYEQHLHEKYVGKNDINSNFSTFIANSILLTKEKLSEEDKKIFEEQGIIPLSKKEFD